MAVDAQEAPNNYRVCLAAPRGESGACRRSEYDQYASLLRTPPAHTRVPPSVYSNCTELPKANDTVVAASAVSEDNIKRLVAYAAAYDLCLDSNQAILLLRHVDLVLEMNKVVNLTRIDDPNNAVIKHIVDSLLFAVVLRASKPNGNRFVDIGTGAGFPGIPFGIVTGYEGLLVDSVAKKLTCVSGFINDLGMSASLTALCVRVENLANAQGQSFDIVLARAVADTSTLLEYASPLLSLGGRLVVSKATIDDSEMSNATINAKLCGMRNVSRETFELPYGHGHRELLTYEKVNNPCVKLPRKAGMARKRPLWSLNVSRETS